MSDPLPEDSTLNTSSVSSKYSGTFLDGIRLPKRLRKKSRRRQFAESRDDQNGCSCVDDETSSFISVNQDDITTEVNVDKALNKFLDVIDRIVFFPINAGMKCCHGDDK